MRQESPHKQQGNDFIALKFKMYIYSMYIQQACMRSWLLPKHHLVIFSDEYGASHLNHTFNAVIHQLSQDMFVTLL